MRIVVTKKMINKRKIAELLSCFSIENVEKEIIAYFLNNFHLDYSTSPVLTNYLHNYSFNNELNLQISALGIDSIKTLEHCLEMLIPDNDRKLNGAFFTPTYIVDYIIDEIKPKENDRNIDPSSGCGAFLIGLVEYYYKRYNKSIRKTVKENIFGADILPYNIERAKRLLSIYALQHGEILEETDFNLYKNEVHAQFTDFEQGMEFARNENKKVLLNFTGYGCVNCRKMEASVWTQPEISRLMNNDFVLISLFVDDKTGLPEPIEITENGRTRLLKTVGDKWSFLQRHKFKNNSQPFYIILDNNGNAVSRSIGYTQDVEEFLHFLTVTQ